ncbi:hypothetical protein RIF29_19734 [Crotalaria pallida]|uniref:Uncharacterized protein n=1 Tax=Crotalaria pallida TaxID=3830 RepID=A0AAN9I7Z5_CROPI
MNAKFGTECMYHVIESFCSVRFMIDDEDMESNFMIDDEDMEEIDGLNEQLEEDSRCLEHLQLQLVEEKSKLDGGRYGFESNPHPLFVVVAVLKVQISFNHMELSGGGCGQNEMGRK